MIWHGCKISLGYLHVFGSQYWYRIPKSVSKTIGPRGSPAMLLGYSTHQNLHRLRDDLVKQIVYSRDVVIHEDMADATSMSHDTVTIKCRSTTIRLDFFTWPSNVATAPKNSQSSAMGERSFVSNLLALIITFDQQLSPPTADESTHWQSSGLR